MIKHTLIFLLFLQLCMSSFARIDRKREFVNFDKGGAFVHCFFQDDKGVVWMGTSHGLSMFDGQRVRRHKTSDSHAALKGVFIFCSQQQDDTHYYLGTDKGLFLFDLEADTYRLLSSPSMSIRAIRQVDESILLLGTLNGLVKYDINQGTFLRVDKIPELPVNPIVKLDDTHFFVTNYNGLYLYDVAADTYNLLSMTSEQFPLILSIAVDSAHQWAWIGTESGLWKYDRVSGDFTKNTRLPDTPIKNMLLSGDGLLWIGTDNGLYIYNEPENYLEHEVHSSKNMNSLVNNIVWNIFEDRDGNIWLGTDSGISLYYNSPIVDTYSWDELVKSDEGNDISCIYRDSRNNFWWGGSNGLCYYNPARNKSLWFKMNQGKYSISHNRIRWIYEDWDKDLWIATDGGINRFDYATETFENYQIVDSTHTRNANWTHYINGDNHANLYLVAYCGGVFVVNKKKLLSQKGKVYVADENYHHHSGSGDNLHSNFVSQAIMDADGSLWVPSKVLHLDQIDFKEKKVHSCHLLKKEAELSGESIRKIVYDKDNNIWIAMTTCLCKITAGNQQMEVIRDSVFNNKEIQSLEDVGDKLWIGTSDGIYAYDKLNRQFVYSGIGGSWISLYQDANSGKIWVGGTDRCLAFEGDDLLNVRKNKASLVLSSLYINDKPVYPHEAYNGHVIADKNISFVDRIHLLPHQNNVAFNFLHTRYDGILNSHYIYRLKGVDDDWRPLEDLGMRISYSNLSPGDYEFELKELVHGENKDAAGFHLNIKVDSPWYLTFWAKGAYVLLALLLILWVVNYFKEKNRFRIERIEKEKTLELSDMKMEFLTNMSNELKTPLNLIINPLSKLVDEVKNVQMKKTLSLIHGNVLKLDDIVQQIITTKDLVETQQGLQASQSELVSFIDSMVKSYQEKMKDKVNTLELLKEEGNSLETEVSFIESQDEKFLNYITEIIEKHLSDSELNVTKLAELSGYHSKQIYRRLKQLTGYTTVEYIRGIRLKKAAMLLGKKQFMVSEVMYMVGFTDSSYFSKCFVEIYGMTPKQYMASV